MVIAFFFIAAPIYIKMESHPLLTNGRPFGNAQLVNGKWAISLQDFAKAFGGTLTLEPNFQLQGNRLSAFVHQFSTDDKHKDQGALLPAVQPAAQKVREAAVVPRVRKAGVVSNNVFMANGQAWVPVADVARAFGGTFTAPAGKLAPGQSLSLNLTVNGDGILAFGQ